jgi:MFS family permease
VTLALAPNATPQSSRAADRRSRVAVIVVFFVHGLLFASWTAHVPQVKEHLGLSNGTLGLALLGAPLGSVLAMVLAGRILPTMGSRRVLRIALVGYCASGPLIGLTGSPAAFFVAFLVWGFFQGSLDVSMNTQAVSVERLSGRVLMPGFHGSWSVGALAGALTGALAVGLGIGLDAQMLLLAAPCLLIGGWLTTSMIPDRGPVTTGGPGTVRARPGAVFQRAIVVLGAIAFADMLCEGAAADWGAVYLHGSLHTVPIVAGLAYTGYALAMVTVRLSGNRLLTRFAARRLVPVLAGVATVGFTLGLLVDRPVGVLVGWACLGAGLGCVVPTVLSAAGRVEDVAAGKAVAAVAGCGWAGFGVGPVVVGGVASVTSLHAALFVIPVLTTAVAAGTATAAVLRRSGPPGGA